MKNYTGAVYRYELALEADQGYTEVLNTLRALKCHLRYHQAAQSAAPVEVLSNCQMGTSLDTPESESRVICRHVSTEPGTTTHSYLYIVSIIDRRLRGGDRGSGNENSTRPTAMTSSLSYGAS